MLVGGASPALMLLVCVLLVILFSMLLLVLLMFLLLLVLLILFLMLLGIVDVFVVAGVVLMSFVSPFLLPVGCRAVPARSTTLTTSSTRR